MELGRKIIIFILLGSLLVSPKAKAENNSNVFEMSVSVSGSDFEVPAGFEDFEEARPNKDLDKIVTRLEKDLNTIQTEAVSLEQLEKTYSKLLESIANQDPHLLDTKEPDGIYEKDIVDYGRELYMKGI